MRAVACFFLMACCLGLAGCSLFGKKGQAKTDQPSPVAGRGWATPPSGAGAAAADQAVAPRGTGILAGRVLDSYDHKPPATTIQVVSAQNANGSQGTPIEVEANEQGFFTVHGLQTGQHYELIARTKDSSPKLAGRIWAIPPNPRITIWMSSDFATQNTPAAPAAPAIPGQKPNPANALPGPNGADQSTGPEDGASGRRNRSGVDQNTDPARATRQGEQRRAVDILPPVRLSDPPPNNGSSGTPQPRAEIRPQDIVFNPNLYAQGSPPVNVPSQTGSRPEDRQLQPSPYASVVPNAAPPVPSCVLTGRQLDNFALYDLNGKRWEYRSHRGRLVLLDFWATYCPPCRAAIPHLKILQDNYGRYGLEVVGIAYESGSFQEQARAVQGVRDRMRINYRLLLGGDTEASACPVRTQFAVDGLPTLVLLDANNRIIWREKGLLDEIKLHDLKLLIESQLRER